MSNFNRRDYEDYIQMLALSAIEMVEADDATDISAAIDASVEGTEYVTYTAQARAVVFEYSANGNIALDSCSWEHITSRAQNIQTVVCRMAAFAVEADVTARVLDIEEKREALEEEQAAEVAWEAKQDRLAWARSR